MIFSRLARSAPITTLALAAWVSPEAAESQWPAIPHEFNMRGCEAKGDATAWVMPAININLSNR